MSLFHIGQTGLKQLVEKPFKLERDLQRFFEEHLLEMTGLEFVASEFSIQNQRFDTLAFDAESSAFTIIEYKRSTNYSVLDQGVSYLNTLLKYKADFVLAYQEMTGHLLSMKQIDWSQTKVIFVAPTFTPFQKQAVDFQDLNIELWEVKRFEHGIVSVSGIKKSLNAPSIKQSSQSVKGELSLVTDEIKTYTETGYLSGKTDAMLELYETLKQALLLMIPDLEIVAQKHYIAFKQQGKNLVCLEIQAKQIKLWLNLKSGTLDDPRGLARDVSSIGHYGTGNYEIKMSDTSYLEYILSLIKQIL